MPAVPRVSVCVPTYNGAAFLRRALDSARRQTFRDFELLVVDDASDDATLSVVRDVARREPRLRLVRNPRRLGLVGNWNRCVTLSRGAWVKFLFQDDTLAPRCLESMLGAARPEDMLVVCRRRLRYEPGVGRGVRALYSAHLRAHSVSERFPGRTRVGGGEFAARFVERPGFNVVGEPTALLVRREAFARWGGFDPELAMLCDWELAARVAVNAGLVWVPAPLATFRVHPGAESALNRRDRRFRGEVLDELLIRRSLAHDPAYAPARRAARALAPAAGPEESLGEAVWTARDLAARYATRARRSDPGAPAALREALGRHPRLAALAAGPDPRPVRPTAAVRRAARALWTSA